MSVLIVGQKADPHIREVCAKLAVPHDVFDCHSFDCIKYSTSSSFFISNVNIAEYESIWWRLKWPVFDSSSDLSKLNEGDFEFWRQEWSQIMWSIAFSGKASLINDPLRSHHASIKPVQLHVARQVGFDVPETLISNNPEEIIKFAKNAPSDIVIKRLSPAFVNVETDYAHLGLAIVSAEYLIKEAEAGRVAPSIMQLKIEKKYELRVNVVGDKIFTSKIDPMAGSDNGLSDWRRTLEANSYTEIETPLKIVKPIQDYMKFFGLDIGAFDFAVTDDDRVVFFECNPEGQWLWIERLTNQPISSEVARLLEGFASRKRQDEVNSIAGHGRVSDFSRRGSN